MGLVFGGAGIWWGWYLVGLVFGGAGTDGHDGNSVYM